MKNIIKTSTVIGFCFFAALLNAPNQASANECPTNPSSAYFNTNGSCYITADVYKVTIYEMGLCLSDPLEGTYHNDGGQTFTDYVIDESTCSPTYKNSNGLLVNLAEDGSQTLTGGTDIRPSAGSYPHAYVKIKNVFGLKGSYILGGTTYYSKSVIQNGAVNGVSDTQEANYTEWNETLVDLVSISVSDDDVSDDTSAADNIYG